MVKKAETRLVNLANHYGWWKHKFSDVRTCEHCHRVLYKSEKALDYYVSQIGTSIECKNNDSSGTWRCAEIMPGGEREIQRESFEKYGGWLFIELADGRAPKKAAAWLVPWDGWEKFVEPFLIAEGMSSIRRETTYNKDGSIRRLGAEHLLCDWELDWEQNTGWVIPHDHIYWERMKDQLLEALENIDEIQRGASQSCQPRLV